MRLAGLVLLLIGIALMLSGCGHALGYGGVHPGKFSCDGKAELTGMGTGYLGAGIGGTETNSFTIKGKCSKFSIEQGPSAPATPAK